MASILGRAEISHSMRDGVDDISLPGCSGFGLDCGRSSPADLEELLSAVGVGVNAGSLSVTVTTADIGAGCSLLFSRPLPFKNDVWCSSSMLSAPVSRRTI